MTSTSFNLIHTQTQNTQQPQPLALRPGQVFHGTIKQLYPDQMAEVQVGGNKLIAKLEVPLKAGDAHFFQVTNTGATPELKVVTGPMSQQMTPQQQMAQLIETMNLPKSTEMQQVLSHFMKTQIPLSKEQLLQAEQWLKNLPAGVSKQDALQAMQRMVDLKMPFTNDVFQALTQGAKINGMSSGLANLAQLLRQPGGNEALKTNVLQQLQTIARPLDSETGGVLLARAVQTLMDSSAPTANKLQALNLLKESGVLPQSANLQNWQSVNSQQSLQSSVQVSQTPVVQAGQLIQQILNAKPENSAQFIEQTRSWLANESLLTSAQKQQVEQLINRFTQLPQTKQTLEVFGKQLQQQLTQVFSENATDRLFTQNESGLSVKGQLVSLIKPDSLLQHNDSLLRNIAKTAVNTQYPAIQSALTQAEAQVQSSVDSKAMEQAITTVLKGLGVSYEAALSSKAGNIQELAQQLKPQLLTLTQDIQTPQVLRDSAETVLARLNGMQLLSSENGHQHQLVMQVPLEFFGKKMDATLQWNGRMKDDGKIDANFARIIFYLQMESIAETVIDMQVQNRVVTINVFNDSPQLDLLAQQLKQSLKAGLVEKDYHLSGIFVKSFEQQAQVKVAKNVKDNREQGGVDFRV